MTPGSFKCICNRFCVLQIKPNAKVTDIEARHALQKHGYRCTVKRLDMGHRNMRRYGT